MDPKFALPLSLGFENSRLVLVVERCDEPYRVAKEPVIKKRLMHEMATYKL